MERLAVDDRVRSGHRLRGQMQTCGEIVGASVGQIPHLRALRQGHQTRQCFVQRPVAAGTYDHIKITAHFSGRPRGIAAALRNKNIHQVSCLGKMRHGVKQRCTGLGLAGTGIDNQQQFFHNSPHFVAQKYERVAIIVQIAHNFNSHHERFPLANNGHFRYDEKKRQRGNTD